MTKLVIPLILRMTLSVVQSLSAGQSEAVPRSELLTADTPQTTVLGKTFIAPAGWSITVHGPATILEAPEGDSWIVLADVHVAWG